MQRACLKHWIITEKKHKTMAPNFSRLTGLNAMEETERLRHNSDRQPIFDMVCLETCSDQILTQKMMKPSSAVSCEIRRLATLIAIEQNFARPPLYQNNVGHSPG